jgi:hypothetical protein
LGRGKVPRRCFRQTHRVATGIPTAAPIRFGTLPHVVFCPVCGDPTEEAALVTTPLRRPLPAVIALAALLLLTALVWWRVLHRDDGVASAGSSTCSTQQPVSGPALPGPGLVTLKVLNATDRSGIAAKARTRLVTDGFNVPAAAANDKPKVRIRGVAEIRFGPKGRAAAKLVHYYLPGAKLVPTDARTATVTVSLGEKYQGIASASSVQAALKDKNIALQTAPAGQPSSGASC